MSVVGPGAPYTWAYPSAPSGALFFTSSATWVVPAGLSKPISMITIGAGGGGGGGYSSTYTGGAGGSGAIMYAKALVTPGTELSIVVGAGGSPGTGGASPTAGGSGGATAVQFASNGVSLCGATGGSGGGAASSSADGANGAGGGLLDVYAQVIGGFGMNGSSGPSPNANGYALVPLLPLGSVVSSTNIVTAYYWYNQNNSGAGGAGGGVNSNGTSGVAGFIMIWWGD